MLAVGENELICDFAETYGITDIWALPVPLLATLASGLRDNSRIKMKVSGNKTDLETLLSAMTVDYLSLIAWIQTGAARQKKPRPESVTDIIQGKPKKEKENDLQQFRTPEEFDAEWARLTGGK